MTEGHIELEVPSRDEAPSPADSVKDDGHNFRLLIVANRLPITIKKQAGVVSVLESRMLRVRADTSIKSRKEDWQLHWLD